MTAIPDATVVSRPYEAGTTMVLNPSGIASAQSVHIYSVRSKAIKRDKPINASGIAKSRIAETR